MKISTFTTFQGLCLTLMTIQTFVSPELDLTGFQIQVMTTITKELSYNEKYSRGLIHCAANCWAYTSCMSASFNGTNKTCHLSVYRFNISDDRLLPGYPSLTLIRKECSGGWVKLGEKCYLFEHRRNNWKKSQEFCKQHGAIIAEPQTKSTYHLIINYLKNVNGFFRYWLGLIKVVNHGNQTYVWSSTGVSSEYTEWKKIYGDIPNNCVVIDHDYTWKRISCKKRNEAICEK